MGIGSIWDSLRDYLRRSGWGAKALIIASFFLAGGRFFYSVVDAWGNVDFRYQSLPLQKAGAYKLVEFLFSGAGVNFLAVVLFLSGAVWVFVAGRKPSTLVQPEPVLVQPEPVLLSAAGGPALSDVSARLSAYREEGRKLAEDVKRAGVAAVHTHDHVAVIAYQQLSQDVLLWSAKVGRAIATVDRDEADYFSNCFSDWAPYERMTCFVTRMDEVVERFRRRGLLS
jgi:hypothetical protein